MSCLNVCAFVIESVGATSIHPRLATVPPDWFDPRQWRGGDRAEGPVYQEGNPKPREGLRHEGAHQLLPDADCNTGIVTEGKSSSHFGQSCL